MPLRNLTRHPAVETVTRDGRGRTLVVVTVKATFACDDRYALGACAQEPIATADEHAGEPAQSGLRQASDVGAPKPLVDVLLAGALRFERPIESCVVSLTVGTRLSKRVRVHGRRSWVPGLVVPMRPSRAAPTTEVPIDWALSFGGADPSNPATVDRRNPVGSGFAKRPDAWFGRPAPQFEDEAQPLGDKHSPAPVGFGPIAAHWDARARFAGTYDERWRTERCPLPPEDFDERFLNHAPADQQLPSYEPGEELALHFDERPQLRLRLPPLDVPVTFVTAREVLETAARVDTIVVRPAERRLSLIARAAFVPLPNVLVYQEAIVGALSTGRRRALESGRRYLERPSATPRGLG